MACDIGDGGGRASNSLLIVGHLSGAWSVCSNPRGDCGAEASAAGPRTECKCAGGDFLTLKTLNSF